MDNKLFRKEAIEKITSPENLNTYIKILSPRIWLILVGIIIAIAGLIVFAASTEFPVWDLFFGRTGG